MSFPGSLPSIPTAAAAETLKNAAGIGHTALHNLIGNEVVAIATKVGTGSSTPTSGTVLRGTGTGTSSWGQVNLISDITGVMPVANGGTGQSTQTGTGLPVAQTSPTINSPTITTPILTVPTISDFTNAPHTHASAAQGGLLNGADAITDGTLTPAELMSGAGSSWVWQTWALTFTNMSGGTLNYAKYVQIGKTVFYRWMYTLAGTGISGSVQFNLPVSEVAAYQTDHNIGTLALVDNGAQHYVGYVTPHTSNPSTTALLRSLGVSGAFVTGATVLSATSPFTWNTGDYLAAQGFYEAA